MWSTIILSFVEQELRRHEAVTVEKHVDKNAFSGACDDLRIGITLIFIFRMLRIYEGKGKEKIDNIH